jgi:hypothetical protein
MPVKIESFEPLSEAEFTTLILPRQRVENLSRRH